MPSKYQKQRTDFVRQRDNKPKEVSQEFFSYKPKNKKK